MLLTYLIVVAVGFVALAWSADRLVEGTSSLARQLNVSAFAIGVVILGFGTSLPELLVSATAAFRGSGGIAIGNAFGSNIANIALILGISALILPLAADRTLVRRDIPLILFGTAGVFLILSDLALERWEGILLMIALDRNHHLNRAQRAGRRPHHQQVDRTCHHGRPGPDPDRAGPPARQRLGTCLGLRRAGPDAGSG